MNSVIRAIIGFFGISTALCAQPAIDPSGIYFNRFEGQFAGTEWFQVVPAETENQYLMTDLRGGGFLVEVDENGTISFTGGQGEFSDENNFSIFPFGGAFSFTCNRAPFTRTNFPLTLSGPPIDGNPELEGQYISRTEFYDPESSNLLGGGEEILQVDVDGSMLRLTDPAGLFFQGLFINPDQVAFREVAGAVRPPFLSFPGSTQNLNLDMLGALQFNDQGGFAATILLQTRAPLGSEIQTLVRFTARRIDS